MTYTRDGWRFERVGAGDLAGDMAEHLHPAWFRKWFHFQPVVLERPEPCNVQGSVARHALRCGVSRAGLIPGGGDPLSAGGGGGGGRRSESAPRADAGRRG